MSTVRVTDDNFQSIVLDSPIPVVVDFWAEWCGPCKIIAPALEELSVELEGHVTIAKMNVDDAQDVPARYGIRGIPTLLLFQDGQKLATKVGTARKNGIVDWIRQNLSAVGASGDTA